MKIRASVTVETAIIMPMVLLVIFFVLCIGFYEHDSAVLIEQSFNSARNQSMYGNEEGVNQNTAEKSCMTAVNISMGTEARLTQTIVASKGNVKIYFLRKIFEINEKQSYVKCYAPELIRLINFGAALKDTILNGK